MNEPPPRPSAELHEVHRLRLVEVAPPPLSPEEQLAEDRAWAQAVRANPNLFDGPAAACTGLAWEGPHSAVISWARTTYRRYARHRAPDTTPAGLPALFVALVQPTEDGRVLVGRMAPWTSTPGRWQLPGGSIEPPAPHEALDTAALRSHAARELSEETGIDRPPEDLTPWLVLRGGARRSVGVVFRAPDRPAHWLAERHAALRSAEAAQGRVPELDRIHLVGSADELTGLDGPCATYLEPVLRHYQETVRRRGA
ncbi:MULTISPECIES: NUDIX hydrolase [unclassified Streptomyces]|uniref:NUDIX hydrolase n=1 Tax=unclassified Streptomyces TaxID=2593676 RepID=UPI00344CED48